MRSLLARVACVALLSACGAKGPSSRTRTSGVPSTAQQTVSDRRVEPVRAFRPEAATALVQGRSVVSDREGTTCFVANSDSGEVVEIDLRTHGILSRTVMGTQPVSLLTLSRSRLLVMDRATSEISRWKREDGAWTREASVVVARDPIAWVAGPNFDEVYVLSFASSTLSTVALWPMEVKHTVSLPRGPRSLAGIGTPVQLFVGHATGEPLHRVDPERGVTGDILTQELRDTRTPADAAKYAPAGPPSANALSARLALVVSANGKWLYASGSENITDWHYSGKEELPPNVRYGVVADVLSTVSLRGEQVPGSRLWYPDRGLLHAAAVSPDDELFAGLHAGSYLVVLESYYRGERDTQGRGTFSWQTDPLMRAGYTPTRIACEGGRDVMFLDSTTVVADCAFAHELLVFHKNRTPIRIGYGNPLSDPVLDRGRRLFATRCERCHLDGSDDGLSWITREGMRQTPTLGGRLIDTAPYLWSGTSSTLLRSLASTHERLPGPEQADPTRNELVALEQWITRGLRPLVPTPPAEVMQPLVENHCVNCHAMGETDHLTHDVGSGGSFNTPSLRSVSISAPYFHDGRYPTLEILLADHGVKMGAPANANDPKFQALLSALLRM